MPHLMSELSFFFREGQVAERGARVKITHQLEHARGKLRTLEGGEQARGNHQLEAPKEG